MSSRRSTVHGPRPAHLPLLSLLLPLLLLLSACEYRAASEGREALRQQDRRAAAPDQLSRDARFFIYENDRPRALVVADRMERYERPDSVYTLLRNHPTADTTVTADSAAGATTASPARRVTARIFDSSEDDESAAADTGTAADTDSASAVIRADRIVHYDEDRRFDARGRVVVTTASGKRLESEHLSWLEEERRITTPGFVEITTPTDRIQGYGLNADENLDAYQIGRVTGQVVIEETP